jgi:hypothetical protein
VGSVGAASPAGSVANAGSVGASPAGSVGATVVLTESNNPPSGAMSTPFSWRTRSDFAEADDPRRMKVAAWMSFMVIVLDCVLGNQMLGFIYDMNWLVDECTMMCGSELSGVYMKIL